MNLALMQPYLFPYLGSLALIDAADSYVIFDNVQYIRRGWMHRNRVHKPGGGWQYLGVPVVPAPRDALIRDIRLSDSVDWRARLRHSLAVAYGTDAPAYDETMSLVNEIIEPEVTHLVTLSVRALQRISASLGIDFRPQSASAIDLDRAPGTPTSAWAVQACRTLGATTYLNPPGGRALYPAEDFAAAGLGLGFVEPELVPYDRGPHKWEAGLSVLDALMFGGFEQTRAALRYRVDLVVPTPTPAPRDE